MKININTSVSVVNQSIETFAAAANVLKPGKVSQKNIAEAKKGLSKNQSGRGAGYSYDYKVDGNIDLNVEIDDEAIIMALPLLIKLAEAASPILSMGFALLNTLSNLKGLLHGAAVDFQAAFNKRFGKEKTYAVASILNEDLKLADVVIVENDGFDNWNLIHAEHCWDIHDTDIIMRMFTAAYKRGEASKDSETMRYPSITFEKITKDIAIDRAIKMRPALQADVDGMQKAAEEVEEK